MNMKYIKGLTILLLAVTCMTACKKLGYDDGVTTFGEVFFVTNSVAIDNNLKVRYNGYPIDKQGGTGRIRVPEGEGKFEFYDDRKEDKVLLEQTVNIIAGSPETFNLFQPSEDSPIAVLDPNGQDNEEAAPEGFMKIKIANYASDLLPEELDLVVLGLDENLQTIELATLESVSNNLGQEKYRQVPIGNGDILAYTFKFRDRKTQKFIQNHGGTDYWNDNIFIYPSSMSPIPEKRIYTIYLKTVEEWGEYISFIKSGDKYYRIDPEILYAN